MSMILNRVGPAESPADTIRKFLSEYYTANNPGFTCMFLSEGGIDAGGMDITPTHPAYVDIPSIGGLNTIRLTFRANGTDGNNWAMFIRSGPTPSVELQGTRNPPRWRITTPNPTTMQEFDDLISGSTDITDTLIVSAVQGTADPTVSRVDFGTYEFDHGMDNVVNRELELTTTDLNILERKSEVAVVIHAGEKTEITGSADVTYNEQIVYIDVKAASGGNTRQHRLIQIADLIEDAVFNAARGPFLKSSDNENSGILTLARRSVDWIPVNEPAADGKTESLHGEIRVRTQRVRT